MCVCVCVCNAHKCMCGYMCIYHWSEDVYTRLAFLYLKTTYLENYTQTRNTYMYKRIWYTSGLSRFHSPLWAGDDNLVVAHTAGLDTGLLHLKETVFRSKETFKKSGSS